MADVPVFAVSIATASVASDLITGQAVPSRVARTVDAVTVHAVCVRRDWSPQESTSRLRQTAVLYIAKQQP